MQTTQTSIQVRVHALSQLLLIFLDLIRLIAENAVDDQISVEHRPLALIALEIFDFGLVVVATCSVFQSAQVAVSAEALEAFLAAEPLNDVSLCQLDESLLVRRESRKRQSRQQTTVDSLAARLPRKHCLENRAIAVVRIDVYVHYAPRSSFLAEQVASVDGLKSALSHADRACVNLRRPVVVLRASLPHAVVYNKIFA